jgi:hypothetical protein
MYFYQKLLKGSNEIEHKEINEVRSEIGGATRLQRYDGPPGG